MYYYPRDFTKAFHHAMLYEVGSHWNPNDPDVIQGRVETELQRRKVGYVNIRADRGGETKYGVAQNANPDINVVDLDLAAAMAVYYDKYWVPSGCDQLDRTITIIHFDGAVNHGPTRAIRFLQEALGATVDGVLGPETLGLLRVANGLSVINNIADLREAFYRRIVERDPSQTIFLNGWMRRISEVREYSLQSLWG